MKQKTYFGLTIIILLLIVVFTLQNTNEVSITLLFWNVKISLALLIFSLFGLGVITAFIFILRPRINTHKSKSKRTEHFTDDL